MRVLCVIMLVICASKGFAQGEIDSLKAIWYNNALLDTARLNAVQYLSYKKYLFRLPDSAFRYAEDMYEFADAKGLSHYKAEALTTLFISCNIRGKTASSLGYLDQLLEQAEAQNDSANIAAAYYYYNIVYNGQGNYVAASDYLEKALAMFIALGNQDRVATGYRALAVIYKHQGLYPESIEALSKSLKIHDALGDKKSLADVHNIFGLIYSDMKDYPKALEYYHKSIAFAEEAGDQFVLSRPLNNIGVVYKELGEYDKAIEYYTRSLDLKLERKQQKGIAQGYNNLGNVYVAKGEYEKAISLFEKSLAIKQEMGNKEGLIATYHNLSHAYFGQNRLAQAIGLGQKSLDLATELGKIAGIVDAALLLRDIHERMGDYQAAFDMQSLYFIYRDSIRSEENAKALMQREFQYTYEKKATADSIQNAEAIRLEQAKSAQQRTINYLAFVIIGITFVFGGLLYNRFRKTRNQKTQIEIEKAKLDEANEKLLELDKSKSRFFTNISHEFRTPLTVISGMADLITEAEPKDLIKRNSQSLLGLVNQILDLRKLESGRLPLHLQCKDIIPYLKYLFESFHSYAESKEIDLYFESLISHLEMDYDAEKLFSILSNLLSNAIKFTPKGGTVKLEVLGSTFDDLGQQPRTQNLEPKTLTLLVSDTGIGIPTHNLPRIFDRFYQVDDSATRPGEGTGVGLTLTRELVRMLGGEISVESEMGKGTTFSVVLPITRAAERGGDAVYAPSVAPVAVSRLEEEAIDKGLNSGDLPTILIVEDNPDVVHYLRTCVEGNYRVTVARDGEEGIGKALEVIPDLIISDVMMPRKDGFELCDTLKKDERTSHIPLVMLTAKADAESRISGLERGADAYLAKPFDKHELLIRLRNLYRLRLSMQARYSQGHPLVASNEPGLQIEDAFMLKVRALIEKHLDDPDFRLTHHLKELGMSRTQLFRKIKALTGSSNQLYIRSVRLQKARELLQSPSYNISDVAYAVGFSDPAYFSRVFVEEVGMSPSAFRGG